MKNLQKLLFAAACASIMSSAVSLCSEKSTETSAIDPRVFTPQKLKYSEFLVKTGVVLIGSHSFTAAAQASHALKKLRRALIKTDNLNFETGIQLKKGIKNNRIGMLFSLATIASPFALEAYNSLNEQNKETARKTL